MIVSIKARRNGIETGEGDEGGGRGGERLRQEKKVGQQEEVDGEGGEVEEEDDANPDTRGVEEDEG